jgi:hypothetical protein
MQDYYSTYISCMLPYENPETLAKCYKTIYRAKLLFKMGFFSLRRVNFQKFIVIKIYAENVE